MSKDILRFPRFPRNIVYDNCQDIELLANNFVATLRDRLSEGSTFFLVSIYDNGWSYFEHNGIELETAVHNIIQINKRNEMAAIHAIQFLADHIDMDFEEIVRAFLD